MNLLRRLTTAINDLRSFWTIRTHVVQVSSGLELALTYRKNGSFLRARVRTTGRHRRFRGDSGRRNLHVPSSSKELAKLDDLRSGTLLAINFLGEQWQRDERTGLVKVRSETDCFSMTQDELARIIDLVRLTRLEEPRESHVRNGLR